MPGPQQNVRLGKILAPFLPQEDRIKSSLVSGSEWKLEPFQLFFQYLQYLAWRGENSREQNNNLKIPRTSELNTGNTNMCSVHIFSGVTDTRKVTSAVQDHPVNGWPAELLNTGLDISVLNAPSTGLILSFRSIPPGPAAAGITAGCYPSRLSLI